MIGTTGSVTVRAFLARPELENKTEQNRLAGRPGGRDGEDRLRGGLVRAERIEPPPGWPSQAAMGSGLQHGRVSAA